MIFKRGVEHLLPKVSECYRLPGAKSMRAGLVQNRFCPDRKHIQLLVSDTTQAKVLKPAKSLAYIVISCPRIDRAQTEHLAAS